MHLRIIPCPARSCKTVSTSPPQATRGTANAGTARAAGPVRRRAAAATVFFRPPLEWPDAPATEPDKSLLVYGIVIESS